MIKLDRIQISYDLKFDTPFHCGTGIREGLIDRTIVRDSEGYLYVPGSTFKGILRERCEQLARFYEEEADVKQLIKSPHDMKIALLPGIGDVTMVTRIFGSPIYPGGLFFDDIRQTDEAKKQYDRPEKDEKGKGKYKEVQVDLYTQVRLDRPTRTTVRGALYTSEFGVRDIIFKGSITGWLECTANDPSLDQCFVNVEQPDDSPTYSLLLLLAGLRLMDRLGGNKSTGKGRCKCQITHVQVNDTIYTETQWKSWLEQLEALSYYYLSEGGSGA